MIYMDICPGIKFSVKEKKFMKLHLFKGYNN